MCPKPVPHDRIKASIAGLPATHGPFVVALRQGLAGTGFVDDESRRVPCGRRLPVGLMLVGRRFEEVTLLIRLARAIGASGDWKLN